MTNQYKDATLRDVDAALQKSWQAFTLYKKADLKTRAAFLRNIAAEMEAIDKQLLATADSETHLGEARLRVELKRTVFQLISYAQACEEGSWLDLRIDTVDAQRN